MSSNVNISTTFLPYISLSESIQHMPDFKSYAEQQASKAVQYPALHGTELFLIREKVTHILGMIGREGIFNEYTKHDISHIDRLLLMLDWVIPKSVVDKMTTGEWLMIVLSIYFHDLGMLVTKDEYDNREKSDFPKFRSKILGTNDLEFLDKVEKMAKEEREKFLYQEFVRNRHAERVKVWISGQDNPATGVSSGVVQEISSMLSHLDTKFKKDLGLICESHHLDDLDDFQKYKTYYRYGADPQENVNIHYCAIILRTVDLLHITSDRTPTTELRLINPSDPKSQVEWSKQKAVSAVAPKPMKNKEGEIDTSLLSNTVEVTAYFQGENGAKGFFGLISYIGYAKHELKQSFEWVKKAAKQGSTYTFPWNDIDDSGIETEGFERKLFEFKLDQSRILQLLVGHTLYNDSTVVLRELIQNSIDAIRLQKFISSTLSHNSFVGKILINWDSSSRILSFTDNGTGMTQEIIENHLLKVGSSRYQSEDFKKEYPGFTPISRFGIGVLTCFMIADNISIISSHRDDTTAKKLTIKNVDGKYLLQHIDKTDLDRAIQNHGTTFNLEIRHKVPMDKLEANIKKWILFPPCAIELVIDGGQPISIGFSSPAHAMESHLTDIGYEVDGKSIKVAQDNINGINIAFALSYSEKFKEWSFLIRNRSVQTKGISPVGTCIEGVRVEFNSPGFNDASLLAVVNASGEHAPKTNVARSNIEATSDRVEFFKSVYKLYFNHVENEIRNIRENTDFSLTWALNEAPILLGPIIRLDEAGNSKASDKIALIDQLENTKLILIEKGFEREVVTIAETKKYENLWTIDCDLFRSAESLIKEIKNSPPLTSLIRTLYSNQEDKIKHLDTLLCTFHRIDSISEQTLQGRYIGSIKVFRVERRVDVCWTKTSNPNWLRLEVANTKRRRSQFDGRRLIYHIQTKPSNIEGINDESFVEIFNNVLVLHGSPINNFISKKVNEFDLESNDEDISIMALLMSVLNKLLHTYSISRSQLDKWSKQLFDQDLIQNDFGVSLETFWKKINQEELFQCIVDTNWSTFSPASWKREKNESYY